MAREEGSRITGSISTGERAAGEERPLKQCRHASAEKLALKPCATKRKAAAADDEKLRSTKRKPPAIGSCSTAQDAGYVKYAPGKKMTRLPQEDVARILSRVIDDVNDAPSDFKALKLQNPDLIPSPEEELDEEMVAYYAGVRAYYKIGEDYLKFQAWVRSEYAKNGYVEVDDDFLAKRARVRQTATEHGRICSTRSTSLTTTMI
ncbi:hypothetical protein CFC21_031941 [Triticum aestivum]|uniref:Uncharacterized protein n=2 Tax=Triticum aestivum TaxID=4565 RepID=A0A3B6DKQ1_WHEAT|nr:hypothetical protein CFC21_031941 [Triticum aestivum]